MGLGTIIAKRYDIFYVFFLKTKLRYNGGGFFVLFLFIAVENVALKLLTSELNACSWKALLEQG